MRNHYIEAASKGHISQASRAKETKLHRPPESFETLPREDTKTTFPARVCVQWCSSQKPHMADVSSNYGTSEAERLCVSNSQVLIRRCRSKRSLTGEKRLARTSRGLRVGDGIRGRKCKGGLTEGLRDASADRLICNAGNRKRCVVLKWS